MKPNATLMMLPVLGFALAACEAEPQGLIVDGPKTANFHSDLAACEELSHQRANDRVGATGGAIVGGLIGGVEADDGDEVGGILAGALLGGLLGSAEDAAEVDEAREQIVFNCMQGRGHKVVG